MDNSKNRKKCQVFVNILKKNQQNRTIFKGVMALASMDVIGKKREHLFAAIELQWPVGLYYRAYLSANIKKTQSGWKCLILTPLHKKTRDKRTTHKKIDARGSAHTHDTPVPQLY